MAATLALGGGRCVGHVGLGLTRTIKTTYIRDSHPWLHFAQGNACILTTDSFRIALYATVHIECTAADPDQGLNTASHGGGAATRRCCASIDAWREPWLFLKIYLKTDTYIVSLIPRPPCFVRTVSHRPCISASRPLRFRWMSEETLVVGVARYLRFRRVFII